MGRRRSYTQHIEVEVDLGDFDAETILQYADEIRGAQASKASSGTQATLGLDYGALTLSFGSWDALKLREAVALGQAYDVLDIIKFALGERLAA